MDISLAGLLGAVLGIILAALIYAPMAGMLERGLRGPSRSESGDRATLAQEVALMRRGLFVADLLLCAGVGYWIGQKLAS